MPRPFLSVIIPAYNEESCIEQTIGATVSELDRLGVTWELLVVDDGSTDRTAAIVRGLQRADPRVGFIGAPHRGKGAAVRRGMLEATGEWRFLADADLSMPIHQLRRFLPAPGGRPADVLIGSREAAGSSRLDEPPYRHLLGRFFNWAVKVLVVGGMEDTQCGYKLFSAAAATALFPLQRLDGFGFDVEILFLARRAGYTIRDVPVTWTYCPRSKVTAFSGAGGFADLVKIRWNQVLRRYPAATIRANRLADEAASATEPAKAGPRER